MRLGKMLRDYQCFCLNNSSQYNQSIKCDSLNNVINLLLQDPRHDMQIISTISEMKLVDISGTKRGKYLKGKIN